MQGGGRPRGRGEDPGQASSFGTGCVVCTGRNSERGAGLVQPSLEATENFLSIMEIKCQDPCGPQPLFPAASSLPDSSCHVGAHFCPVHLCHPHPRLHHCLTPSTPNLILWAWPCANVAQLSSIWILNFSFFHFYYFSPINSHSYPASGKCHILH